MSIYCGIHDYKFELASETGIIDHICPYCLMDEKAREGTDTWKKYMEKNLSGLVKRGYQIEYD